MSSSSQPSTKKPKHCSHHPDNVWVAADRAINGNGRWKVQWYAHPCPVGNSKLIYSVVNLQDYWMSIVISNTL